MTEEPKKLSDEERFQLDQPPDDGEGYGEPTRDPTWRDLTEGYIHGHSDQIKALDARLTELEGRKEKKEPTPEPEKGPTITMSLKSWDNLDNELSMAEHYLVGIIARIRNVRNSIYNATSKKLVDQARSNLIKTMELGKRMEEQRQGTGKVGQGHQG